MAKLGLGLASAVKDFLCWAPWTRVGVCKHEEKIYIYAPSNVT